MALKCLCHGTKYPLKTPLFGLLIIGVPWHKKDFSDLVPGTHIEGLGYFFNITKINVFLKLECKRQTIKSRKQRHGIKIIYFISILIIFGYF
jgi:hypothetical protein